MLTGALGRCLAAAVLCAVLVIFSIFFIDRPVERLVAAHAAWRPLFQLLCVPAVLPLPCACCYLAVRALGKAAGTAPALSGPWMQVSIATIAATAAKDELKWIFGRPWPQYWMTYRVYGFHPLDTGYLYGSFPSGHTAYIAAPMLVLFFTVPRLRIVWAGVILTVMIGLVGAGYHFVADVIAGLFVGLAAAAGTLVWLGPRNA